MAVYLTSSEKEQKLKGAFIKKYKSVPKYFSVLFRVTGIDKTAYKTEILELSDDFQNQNQ